MKFNLGDIVGTPAALKAIADAAQHTGDFLSRHMEGDWGEVCDGDKRLNDEAVVDGSRILSAYKTKLGEKIWIITEADRSVTTILLPEQY